jgi:acyl carrier protein
MDDALYTSKVSRDTILLLLVHILEDMTSEWDMDFQEPIGSKTRLIKDLEFESIDVVQFVVAVEEQFRQRGLPWEKFLMNDGRYVDEVIVDEVVTFLHSCLNSESKGERNVSNGIDRS